MAFINPPQRIPWYLKIGLWISKKKTGKDLLPGQILAWFPKAAIGSGILESLTPTGPGDMESRLLKLVRLKSSFRASCQFCIDMNFFEYDRYGITENELNALQGKIDINKVGSFTKREAYAIRYAEMISSTPLLFDKNFIEELKKIFNEREIVILAAASSQVNYWARLIQALGIPPAGFSESCKISPY